MVLSAVWYPHYFWLAWYCRQTSSSGVFSLASVECWLLVLLPPLFFAGVCPRANACSAVHLYPAGIIWFWLQWLFCILFVTSSCSILDCILPLVPYNFRVSDSNSKNVLCCCIKTISFAPSMILQLLHGILGLPHASAKQF